MHSFVNRNERYANIVQNFYVFQFLFQSDPCYFGNLSGPVKIIYALLALARLLVKSDR